MKPSSFFLRWGGAVSGGGLGKRLGPFACLLALGCFWTSGNLHADTLPDTVSVLPVFFVPQGESAPTEAQKTKLMQHLSWARQRYFEMLKFRATFALATTTPLVYKSSQPLSYYEQNLDQGGGASQYVCELLNNQGYTRTNCPYIFFVVVMNPASTASNPAAYYPPGSGARSINGGYNTGGGLVQMSSHYLDLTPNLQSTVQHELGHSFRLPHVESYGYSMTTNGSIMSYNPDNQTNEFTDDATPGVLIPEDFRGLAANRRVFPVLYFDAALDVPGGYVMADEASFGPMDLETGINPAAIRQAPSNISVPFDPHSPRNVYVNGIANCSPAYNPIGDPNCSLFVAGPFPAGIIPGGAFTTIADGVNAARAGDTLRVTTGSYNEPVHIVKKLKIQPQGGSVIIGR